MRGAPFPPRSAPATSTASATSPGAAPRHSCSSVRKPASRYCRKMDETFPLPQSVVLEKAPAVRRAARPIWREWLETILTTVAFFFLVEMFVVQGYKVYGSCMEPNLFTGERILG